MPIINDDDFRAWEADASEHLRGDPVWRFNAYLRAVGSISANIAEGLGRTSAAERSRFFGIALGSLREAQTWYAAVASELSPELVDLRLGQLTELRRLLIGAQKWLASQPQRTQLM